MRRQKCDRKLPCTRCVRDGKSDACSLEWPEGYNPRIHRKYPNPKITKLDNDRQQSEAATTSRQNDDSDTIGNEMSHSPVAHSSPPAFESARNPSPIHRLQSQNTDFGMLLDLVNPYEPGESSQAGPIASNADPPGGAIGQNPDKLVQDASCLSGGHLARRCNSDQELAFLQSLIPSCTRMQQLIDFHETHLAWFHNGLNFPAFRREVLAALQNSGSIELQSQDLRWCALLFAVMAASLACADTFTVRSWGFGQREKRPLAQRWYEAVTSCLQLGQYASKHHLYSIQAILVGTISAHTLGFSNEQFVLFGGCYRIAQSLGLQRLAIDDASESPDAIRTNPSRSQRETLIKRETGRKIWIGLCTQDWLSIASYDMYCLHKKQFTTSKPRRINEETMLLAEDRAPIGVDFGNYVYDISSLMADFHDATTGVEDVSEHYDLVLKFDSRLRAIGPETCLPLPLMESAGKPGWIKWARHTCRILHAHKLIMIHRRFLSRSFSNPKFTYTRWASVASAKKILEEVELACLDPQIPSIWSCQVRQTIPPLCSHANLITGTPRCSWHHLVSGLCTPFGYPVKFCRVQKFGRPYYSCFEE